MESTITFEQASLWEIVKAAPLAVQLVMGLLVLLSIATWAIIIEKGYRIWQDNRQARNFEVKLEQFKNYPELLHPKYKLSGSAKFEILQAGIAVFDTFEGKGGFKSHHQIRKINRRMNDQLSREMAKLERQMMTLASIGTAAPFIGLFGTVWGVMNAFMSIAATGNTTLDVVAPGIAEALLATALGLIAAIPASVAYNKYANDLVVIATDLESFVDQFCMDLTGFLEGET